MLLSQQHHQYNLQFSQSIKLKKQCSHCQSVLQGTVKLYPRAYTIFELLQTSLQAFTVKLKKNIVKKYELNTE